MSGPTLPSRALRSETIQLVYRTQHNQALTCILFATESNGFQHSIKHLATVDLDNVVAP